MSGGARGAAQARLGSRPSAREIRFATADDLTALAEIENASDTLFNALPGFAFTGDAPSGTSRAARPGFILTAAESPDGPAIGFAHVIEHGPFAHLEQLSIQPSAGRRGHGRALVESVIAEAAARGLTTVTLRTFAEVPWNGPFYESCGFEIAAPIDDAFYLALLEEELKLGLHRLGTRVLMATPSVPCDRPRETPPPG